MGQLRHNFLLTALFVPVILVFFSVTKIGAKHKLVVLFNISQPAGEQPRLSYPEHFEQEFNKCLHLVAQQEKSLLVIVDDLDRCDDKTVIDALSVIKQFAGKKNCAFIVPCDEAQVLKAINKEKGKHDYQYESLRKFFDVAVRMDTIPEADLHNYAKYLINSWKLPPRIAEIAVYSGARDARKVKSFLNAFRTRYWVIKEREEGRYFEKGTAQRNVELIAKLTALQEGFPDFYKKVCTDASILDKIEQSLRVRSTDVYDKKKPLVDVSQYTEGNENLERFLRYTSDIDLGEIGDIVVGKRPEQIAGIPTGSSILAAFAEGKPKEFVEAIKGLDKKQCNSLIDYIRFRIRDFKEQDLSVSLRIYVQCILEIFSDKTVWADDSRREEKRSIADIIVDTVTESQKGLIKEIGNLIAIESVLEIASEPHKLANSVIQTYLKEPAASDGASYLSLFNRGSKHFGEKLKDVNSAMKKALQGEQENQILNQLIDPEVKTDSTDPIPSDAVVNQIVEGLQPDEDAYEINKQRIQIIHTYPDRVAIPAFLNKWIELTAKAQSSAVELEGTNFGLWLGILNKIGKFGKERHAELILQPVLSIWTHNENEKIRQGLLTTFALIYPVLSDQSKEKVKTNIFNWLNTRSQSEIKEYLNYLTEDRELPESKQSSLYALAVYVLESFVEWLKSQVNAYNERVEEITSLVVEHHSILQDETKLTDLVDIIVKEANDPFFEKWHTKSLGSLCDCLSEETQQNLGQTVFERIEDPPTTKVRRNLLLDLLITKFSPKGLGGTETDRIFKLLWHDDSNIREPVCEKFASLKSKFGKRDFNRNISIMSRDISNSSVEKITQKVNAVSAFLKNLEDLSEQDTKMVLSIVPSLIRSTNSTESIGVGLEMLDTLADKNNVSQDILSGLEALLEHSDENLKKRAEKLLLDKFQAKGRVSKQEKDIEKEQDAKEGD